MIESIRIGALVASFLYMCFFSRKNFLKHAENHGELLGGGGREFGGGSDQHPPAATNSQALRPDAFGTISPGVPVPIPRAYAARVARGESMDETYDPPLGGNDDEQTQSKRRPRNVTLVIAARTEGWLERIQLAPAWKTIENMGHQIVPVVQGAESKVMGEGVWDLERRDEGEGVGSTLAEGSRESAGLRSSDDAPVGGSCCAGLPDPMGGFFVKPKREKWRGRVAGVNEENSLYLTYIIAHYDSLPETLVFVQDHWTSWHQNGSLSDRLPDYLDSFQRRGYRYTSLAAVDRIGVWPPLPAPLELFTRAVDLRWTSPVSGQLATYEETYWNATDLHKFFGAFPKDEGLPHHGCCAQFVVASSSIKRLPRSFYRSLRRWMLRYTNAGVSRGTHWDGEWSPWWTGRMPEFTWETIFTCPTLAEYSAGHRGCWRASSRL